MKWCRFHECLHPISAFGIRRSRAHLDGYSTRCRASIAAYVSNKKLRDPKFKERIRRAERARYLARRDEISKQGCLQRAQKWLRDVEPPFDPWM